MTDRRQKQRERYEFRAAELEVMRLTTADRPLQRRYGEFEARYRELADSFGEAIEVHTAALTALKLH